MLTTLDLGFLHLDEKGWFIYFFYSASNSKRLEGGKVMSSLGLVVRKCCGNTGGEVNICCRLRFKAEENFKAVFSRVL